MPLPEFAIIIPACDEAACIGTVLDEFLAALDPEKFVIAVGVNGSTDQTAQIARQRPVLVAETDRRGYGHGCQAAIDLTNNLFPAIRAYIFCAGDGATDPRDLACLTTAFEEGYDFVVGSRTKRLRNWRTMTLRHLVANAALGLWCGVLCGRPFSDLGPLRIIGRRLFEKIAPQEMTFGWTIEAQIAAVRLGAAICETPGERTPPPCGRAESFGRDLAAHALGRLPDRRGRGAHAAALSAGAGSAQAGLRALQQQPATRSVKRWFWLAAVLLTGCGTFNKPALPKFATGEAPRPAAEDEAWAAGVRRADVIYVGLTKKSAAESQPAWRIVETLQRSGTRVALGWSELPVTQQPLLDQWQRQEISAEQLVEQLGVPPRGDWMRQALRPDLVQVALGSPRELLRKIQRGEALSENERALLPADYRPRPEAFDNFVDRVSTSPRLRRYNTERLYRAHIAAEQMIAESIVRFMQENAGTKLLVFLPDDAMINPREVADYAAQKSSLRQMILDRSHSSPAPPQLLAAR